jgi:hypothetical protein
MMMNFSGIWTDFAAAAGADEPPDEARLRRRLYGTPRSRPRAQALLGWRQQSLPPAIVPLWKAEEVLVLDPRGSLTPAEMVTQKLEALLCGTPSAATAGSAGNTGAGGRGGGSRFQPLSVTFSARS